MKAGTTSATKWILAALFCLISRQQTFAQHPPNLNPPPDIIRELNVVHVPYGRSVYLNPVTDLNIHVEEGDHCQVKVLPDALSQMPGFLSPGRFRCDFGFDEVKYSHLGSRSPSEDLIRLQIRYDTPTETFIIPFTLTVDVLFIQRTVITTSMFLTVNDLLGVSEPIDHEILGFTYDEDVETCEMATLSGNADLPHYGRLIGDISEGSMVPCNVFLESGVRYEHTATTRSPNRDQIPMVVVLRDFEGNMIKQEYFQVTVKILEGIENTPPKVDFASVLMMEVNQFVMTAFTSEMLRASDVESNPNDLIFNITSALRYQEGEIVSTDNRNQPITSFLQSDVNEFKIAYKPPSVDSDIQRILEIEMQIVDTDGMVSDPFNFIILVQPMNTMAPVATRNTGQLLYQGQSRSLSTAQNLEISDEDNLDDVKIYVLKGPRHGRLDLGPKTYFTPTDLDVGSVVYYHDGSNTYSDNVIFRMTDGDHDVEFLFPITIASLDNTPPNVDTNTGLIVSKGQTELVSSWVLNADDIDSDPMDIYFILEEPFSTNGEFVLVEVEPPAGPDADDWSLTDAGDYEKVVNEWSQIDILDMKLYYRHIGDHSTEVVMDVHPFFVQDSSDPPNQSEQYEFVVKVLPVDDIAPELYPGTTLQMHVEEFELTPFNKKILRYTDQDTADKDLLYTVTGPIVELSPVTPLSNTGKLVLTEEPDTEVATFTQAQINHHKIAYQPPNIELGIIARAMKFTFAVSDDAGNELPGQEFTIFLRPVDNKPPRIVNTGFTVNEWGRTIITPSILDATDEDTDENILSFVLTSLPQHGDLKYDNSAMNIGGAFTRNDIIGNHIAYKHDGSESKSDSFDLLVSDGMHEIPIIVHVTINPIDDEQPLLASDDGTLQFTIEVPERGKVTITPKILSATDKDSDDLMLTFLVTQPAGKGLLLVNGDVATSFTQKDIRDHVVQYEHVGGEIGGDPDQDSFKLKLSDMSHEWRVGGNAVDEVDVTVDILPVDSEAPQVAVGDILHVDEGGRAMIEPIHLNAHDADTNDDDVLCVVTTQASEGFIENDTPAPGSEKSRSGTPISSFTIGDIRAGNIFYVQSVHEGSEPTEDRFSFLCQDGTPNLSQTNFFTVAIDPVNDETPRLYNTEFVVEEGGILTIDLPRLNAEDDDVPEDQLIFTIIEKPQNGVFVRSNGGEPVEVTSFSLRDVATGSDIEYRHDDTETTEDKFEIEVSDGEHVTSRVIPITVIPVDDETPRMTINNGIDVELEETKVIRANALKATDLDSDDKLLTYVITFPSQHGLLNLTDVTGGVRTLGVGGNFTQADIDEGRITYTHIGQEGVRDLIKFDVTDGYNPLIDRYFYVNVAYMDMLFPDVINKGVTLKEGGRVTLTTSILSTADLNSADERLVFTIAQEPSRGHLELTDRPGVPISTFTQLDLAGNKVQYVHTEEDEIKMDSFEFEVTDGLNPVYRTFRISIADVDNKKPIVTISPVTVKEGGSKLITPFELNVEDYDTVDGLLSVHITQIPVHGKILKNGEQIVRDFTMEDLNENRISYKHDGSETIADSFSFVVTDGTHDDFYVFPNTVHTTEEPQRLDIVIAPVDNGVPQILLNRGAPTVSELPSGDKGFRITKKILRADDRDSDVSALTYVITKPAEHGKIVNILVEEDQALSNFTQGDIDSMAIYYILNPDTTATSDVFTFTVRDAGNNELTGQKFRLNWAFISLENATYRVGEDDKYIQVTLKRRGYLGETSFISIFTKDGTAKSGVDFKGRSSQVQFNPGQTTGTWKVKILQDGEYEESENFIIQLSEPVMAIMEEPRNATVTITDVEDESTVFIPEKKYIVEEDVGELLVPVHRSGDISNELMVICHTSPGKARGTTPTTVLSYSDYISRPNDHNSLIRFEIGESVKHCPVVIIDDSLYEDDEEFSVILSSPMGGRLGDFASTEVLILADDDDEPLFYFDQESYEVDESAGHVEVRVWRTGTDLTQTASITVQSRKSEPESASANDDYVGISRTLEFAPGITMQNIKIVILDDLGSPVLEGLEHFDLVLRMPVKASLGEPNKAQIIINDSVSDLPLMQFQKPEYEVKENNGSLTAMIVRSGDLSQTSAVRCYTRQMTAEVMMDYAERPNTDASLVHFEPGQSEARCVVAIENDGLHEEPEQFRLVLGTPSSGSAGQALVGELSETIITINDEADKPVIEFAQTTFEVTEPVDDDDVALVRIPVVRRGDLNEDSVVRIFTKDGNAQSGKDYNPISKVLKFDKNVSEIIVEIEVLFDEEKEIRESFTVRLNPDQNMVAELGEKRAIIYVNQQRILADVTFPSKPNVVSLLDYDDMENAPGGPSPGYPVICISPCNPKHSNFAEVSSICESEGLDDKATQFRWLVAAASGIDGVTNPLREVAQNTFFTDTNEITLDSIYFKSGSRIACAARAVNNNGDVGLESISEPVTVSDKSDICPSRIPGSVGAEPFSAKIRYTGPADPIHPNLIKISISMPHIDGMLPAISTRQLSNFEITLSNDGMRAANHRCSNIINFDEWSTQYGFLTEATRNLNIIGETYPYQFDPEIRGNNTLRFYRNLNLEACLWEFTTYFDMSELLSECGGSIGTDGQVLNAVQSYVSLRVPLYVSYIFHSPVASGWQHFDQQTELRLTFVYDTAILWEQGIGTPPESNLQGYLYPTSMRIRDDGRLVVNFRTEARFRGQFVAEHAGTEDVAMVMSSSHPELQMSLNLIRSDPTYNNPEQKWSFVSDYAVRDYAGTYTIKLIPCTTPAGQAYSLPIVCNPRQPISFDMDIRFQQVSDPVAAEFSLNTNFYLLSKKSLYLSDGSMGFGEDSDVAFAQGAEIFGRVLVDPVQNLGDSFDASIEKVFLCSGRDGYVPKYNPENNEFGCLADTPNLREQFKVLDKEQPDTQDEEANNVKFNAKLALDDVESFPIVQQSGTDGFRMDSAPLFTVTVGREWYMHAIYIVKATDERKRRSTLVSYHSLIRSSDINARKKRAAELAENIGEEYGRGTQMMYIKFNKAEEREALDVQNGIDVDNGGDGSSEFPLLAIVIAGCGALVIIVAIVAVVLVKRRKEPAAKDTAAKGKYIGGKHIVKRKRGAGARTASSVRSSSGYSSSDAEV